jgi:uncharacterized membrane protein (GlpM family)
MQLILLRGLLGGLFVMVFALFAETLSPKRFAGIFAATPAVALASLLITATVKGSPQAAESSTGMLAGSVGMVAYCVASVPLVARFKATVGSVLAWGAWFVAGFGAYFLFLR